MMKGKIICIGITFLFVFSGLSLSTVGMKVNVSEKASESTLIICNDGKPDLEIVYLEVFSLYRENTSKPEQAPEWDKYDLGLRIKVKNNGPGDIATGCRVNGYIYIDGEKLSHTIQFIVDEDHDYYPGDWKSGDERKYWSRIYWSFREYYEYDFDFLLKEAHGIDDTGVSHEFKLKIDADDLIDEGGHEDNNEKSITYVHKSRSLINNKQLLNFLESNPLFNQIFRQLQKLLQS